MKIHKVGYKIIITCTVIFAAVVLLSAMLLPGIPTAVISGALLLLLLFIIRFFRVPKRPLLTEEGTIFSPADGKVVVVEPTEENEYLKERRIQVSVFMSVWNVHINWFPVSGEVEYFRHHNGKFMVAWHPKSSEENEHTTIVVNTGKEKILLRQIAGMVARRIVSYAPIGKKVAQNSQCGFIKFGSRVDVLLPEDAEICVSLGQKVVGSQTVIARLKR